MTGEAPVRLETRSLRSDPAKFRSVRRWIADVAIEEGFDPDDARRLSLALNEVFANAHRHAYGGRDDGRIDVEVEVAGGAVRVSVRDYGAPFDPFSYLPPDLTAATGRGYGVYLMQALMDRVDFDRTPIGTRVVLEKRRRPADGVDRGKTERRPG